MQLRRWHSKACTKNLTRGELIIIISISGWCQRTGPTGDITVTNTIARTAGTLGANFIGRAQDIRGVMIVLEPKRHGAVFILISARKLPTDSFKFTIGLPKQLVQVTPARRCMVLEQRVAHRPTESLVRLLSLVRSSIKLSETYCMGSMPQVPSVYIHTTVSLKREREPKNILPQTLSNIYPT